MRIKKCQPGFICLDNMMAVFIGLVILILGYNIFAASASAKRDTNVNVDVEVERNNNNGGSGYFNSWFNSWIPSYPYNNLPLTNDPLMNPYNPPFRDERYFVGPVSSIPPMGPMINPVVGGLGAPGPTAGPMINPVVPINVATSAVDTAFRQIGILTPLNETSKDNVLPLMGRPLFTRRSKWQYYSISNQHNNVKLSVLVKQRSGLDENGVDELYTGDTVMTEGTDKPYKVTKYENSTIQYLPFI